MKHSAMLSCRLIATICVAAGTLPVAAIAQETPASELPAAPAPLPEKRFVSDKLVLNVYAEADQSSDRLATIQTGDAVEELERAGNMVRVRLEDGREGWVGANYLTSDEPAIIRLRELQRQQPNAAPRVDKASLEEDKASLEEIARLKEENTALLGQVSELEARLAAPVEPPPQGETILAPPEPPLQATVLPTTTPTGVAGWVLAMIAVGAASFASGYQMLARRLRKKFGGLKIY